MQRFSHSRLAIPPQSSVERDSVFTYNVKAINSPKVPENLMTSVLHAIRGDGLQLPHKHLTTAAVITKYNITSMTRTTMALLTWLIRTRRFSSQPKKENIYAYFRYIFLFYHEMYVVCTH